MSARGDYSPPQAIAQVAADAAAPFSIRARPKFSYLRSEPYRRWVASLACICCGIEGMSQCAHSNQARHGHGRSIKASDAFTFPLCAPHGSHMGCHYMHDNRIDATRAECEENEARWIEKTQAMAADAGFAQLLEAA